jgi:hypothetical protein
MQALDPSEVRAALAKEGGFEIEAVLDDSGEGDPWGFAGGAPGAEADSGDKQLKNPDPLGKMGPGGHGDAGDDDVGWITVNGAHIPIGTASSSLERENNERRLNIAGV